MRIRIFRFLLLFIVGVFILGLYINTASASRTRSGSGVLGTDATRESTIIGYLNGQIEGSVTATEGSLEVYVIHNDDYVDASSINSLECIVYEQGTTVTFNFAVLTEGDWVLILQNTNPYEVHYQFSWTSTEPEEILIDVVSPVAIPTFLFLIALGYVITIQRGAIPDFKDYSKNSQLSATIGFVFILLSLILPNVMQLNRSGNQGNMLVALLWTLTSDDFRLHFASSQNPFVWIMPLVLIGPTLLFPFSVMSYYQGRITKRQMVKRGIISIIPLLVITGLGLLTLLISPSYPLIILPLPLVFILGLIVSKYVPAPTVSDIFGDSKTE
ncbi:MAG: hypothetical protein ACW98Y_09825 [Candidatus Thorarchaeota archaeon]